MYAVVEARGFIAMDDTGVATNGVRAVVLVEGLSDRLAVEALAVRRGIDLVRSEVAVIAMGGATNARRFLQRYGPAGADVVLTGLYDDAEEGVFRRAFARAGLAAGLDRAGLAAQGFHACVVDLEDELIRALGVDAVLAFIAGQGDLPSFRILQQQPAQQGRTVEQQLRRFMGTRGGRKIEYAPLLVQVLDLARVPAPLDRVLERASSA